MEDWEIELSHEQLVEWMRAYMGTYLWQEEELFLRLVDVRVALAECFGDGCLGRRIAFWLAPVNLLLEAVRIATRHNTARAIVS